MPVTATDDPTIATSAAISNAQSILGQAICKNDHAFQLLPAVSLGAEVAEWTAASLVPSHGLVHIDHKWLMHSRTVQHNLA